MTTQTQDLSQALVVFDSQFAPSFVEDSHPMSEMAPDSEVFAYDSLYVPVVLVEPTTAVAAAAAVEPENVAAAFAAKRQTLQLFQRTLYLRLKLNYWY